MEKKFQKVFVAGTFDHFHIGHQFFLWSAHGLAEEMVVVVARDKTVSHVKNISPTFPEEDRLARLVQENFSNTSIRLGREDRNFLATLEEENPDALFLGFDQRFEVPDHPLFENIEVLRAEPYFPEFFKSSKFRT